MSGHQVVNQVFTGSLGPGGAVGGVAFCPAPKQVLGGGYSVSSSTGGDNVSVWSSQPNSTTGWAVKAQRDSTNPPGFTNITLTVWAICANVGP